MQRHCPRRRPWPASRRARRPSTTDCRAGRGAGPGAGPCGMAPQLRDRAARHGSARARARTRLAARAGRPPLAKIARLTAPRAAPQLGAGDQEVRMPPPPADTAGAPHARAPPRHVGNVRRAECRGEEPCSSRAAEESLRPAVEVHHLHGRGANQVDTDLLACAKSTPRSRRRAGQRRGDRQGPRPKTRNVGTGASQSLTSAVRAGAYAPPLRRGAGEVCARRCGAESVTSSRQACRGARCASQDRAAPCRQASCASRPVGEDGRCPSLPSGRLSGSGWA